MNAVPRGTDRLRAAALTFAFACPVAALAGAVTDGSVGAVQTLSGRFVVPQTLGSVKGGNLFHSFASFGVASGESATFTTSSAAIQNVITRVTGGTPSAIYGPLTLQAAAGSRPDFFFINPAGVLFGAGAQIDVPGGFHVSTAQQLKFADGFVWDTGSPTVSGLTVAAPEAFGFLGRSSPAMVGFTNLDADGVAGDSPSVSLPAGSSLTIAAGTVGFEGTTLQLPSTSVQVAAAGSVPAKVPLGLSLDSLNTPLTGALRLSNSTLSVGSSGVVILHGGSIDLNESQVAANSLNVPAETAPGAVIIRAAGGLSVTDSMITAITNCDAPGGFISVKADSLILNGPSAQLRTDTLYGKGKAGVIDVFVRNSMVMTNNAQIGTSSLRASGDAGTVSIKAGSLRVDGGGAVYGISAVSSHGTGNAGTVLIDVANDLSLTNGGVLQAYSIDGGDGGVISIKAKTLDIHRDPFGPVVGVVVGVSNSVMRNNDTGSIHIDVQGAMSLTGGAYVGSSSNHSSGKPGQVSINAGSLHVEGDGVTTNPTIENSTFNGTADAGPIAITVADDMTTSKGGRIVSYTINGGTSGSIKIDVGKSMAITDDAIVTSGSFYSVHDAGNIDISVGGPMVVGNGGMISSGTYWSNGNAGTISIKADSLTMGGTGVFSVIEDSTFAGTGHGGKVSLDIKHGLTLASGGLILSSSERGGDSGSITIKAEELNITGTANTVAGLATESKEGDAQAGSIDIEADRVFMSRNAIISSSTYSSGTGGSVTLHAGSLTMDGSNDKFGGTRIESRAGGTDSDAGNAGGVKIVATGEINLLHGAMVMSDTRGGGSAGTVEVNAGQLTIDGLDAPGGAGTTGIFGSAWAGSSGQTGQLIVHADRDLIIRNGGVLSIANEATVANPAALLPSTLSVSATNVSLDHAEITAEATGNANASHINVVAANRLQLNASSIRTSAVDGDGGNIRLSGNLIRLTNSVVTTSVGGFTNGNGGNIDIVGNALVLKSGFIQANTMAPLAQGGNITIDTRLLLVDGGNLLVGGNAVQSFMAGGLNVIQAAAPDGVAGNLQITTPELNLAGTLSGLSSPVVDFGPLARDQCRVGDGSSFTLMGSGALPLSAADLTAAER
jgi:filamentous hemagglutinin family protein